MENRYGEGRTQDVLRKPRGHPRTSFRLTQADFWGCAAGRLQAGWEQDTALGRELFLLGVA